MIRIKWLFSGGNLNLALPSLDAKFRRGHFGKASLNLNEKGDTGQVIIVSGKKKKVFSI